MNHQHYRNKLVKISKILFIQAIIIFSLLEILGRILDPLGISYYPEMAKYLDTLIIEEPIGYRNRPRLQGKFFGTSVVINSLGMRDREVVAPAANEFRILVLGDSVPFGVGVQYEATFPYQLEQILNTQFQGVIRTLNMGVPSYNTEQEWTQLQTLGITLQPNLVMLLFVSNDIEPKMWVFDKRQAWYANLAQRSYATTLLFILYREVKRLASTSVSLTEFIPAAAAGEIAWYHYHLGDKRWQAIDQSLTAMNALLRRYQIPFVVFTYQEADFILNLLHQVSDREGFPLINLVPWQDPRWSNQDLSQYVNSYVDQHPNAAGHLMLATLIAENLMKLKVFSRIKELKH
jgi:lysophospholipase L1-like esterase